MKVDVDFERTGSAQLSLAQGLALFDDLEANIRLFPRLARLTPLGPSRYRWELEPLGTAGISHVVSFGSLYAIDRARGSVRWTPIAGEGNAAIHGAWTLVARGDSTQFSLRVGGTLDQLSVPLALRPLAGPFVKGQFGALLGKYFERSVESALAKGRPA